MLDKIVIGDCLDVMRSIKESSIDLIYLDPPFFTEKTHKSKNKTRTKEFSFDDTWGNDTNYATFLRERIEVMRNLLKDDGSIFVHCDKSGEHIVRNVLDTVFGAENFRSEIIWHYKRWSNSKKGLLPNHQNIYFYSKSKNFKFNLIYTPYSETTNIDQIQQNRTRDEHNKTIYAKDDNGGVQQGGEKKGVPLSDVWDIPYLNPKAKERTGYPTQKPLVLLERIIQLVTKEEDIVLDPFCGSGTTCVAAKINHRHFIGIDKSKDAVILSQQRIENPVKTDSNLLKKGRASYQTADKTALSFLDGIGFNPVQRNKGIDAILIAQYENHPILVRVQRKNESVAEAISFLAKAMKTKKSKKSFLIQTNEVKGQQSMIALPEGIHIIQSPAMVLTKMLKS